jgi:hypothetical protein
MSWVVASSLALGATGVGIYGAESKRKSDKDQNLENEKVNKASLLTTKYNIQQDYKESQGRQADMLEQGGRALAEVMTQGKKDQDEMLTEGGSSGALVSSGTTLDVLMSNAINNTVQQHSVVEATKESISNEQRNVKNRGKSNWLNAKQGYERNNRQTALNEKRSKDEYLGNILGSIVSGGKTYVGAGGGVA